MHDAPLSIRGMPDIVRHAERVDSSRSILGEFVIFGLKQAWACLVGALLLVLIVATRVHWPGDALIARYDFLLMAAVTIQLIFLATGMETREEAKVILVFHVVGTVMEIFKTTQGSWSYPEESLIRIGDVPLFSGFMYASVGSYISRIWRILDLRFSSFPPVAWAVLLCVAIYTNFFTHHFVWDMRYVLFAVVALIFARTWVHFTPARRTRRMPLLVGFGLVAIFIWLAENIATLGQIWVYPHQQQAWTMVPIAKLGSWYLLMLLGFVLVSLVHKPHGPEPVAVADCKNGTRFGHRTGRFSAAR